MLDFPSGPAINDTWTGSNGAVYTWNGTMWTVSGSGVGPYLPLAGGTMTGALTLPGNAASALQAVPLQQVPAASSTTPVMDGVATIGSGTTWARADHIHPTDTSRYAASNPSGYQTAAQVAAVIPGTSYADNGGFAINQRGYVSGTALAAGIYGHDRWKAGAGGCTYTFTQSGNPATTITITAGTLQQVVEGVAIVGGAYTLSWAGTAQGRVGAGSYAASPVTVGSITAGANTTIEFNTGTLGRVKFEAGSIATPWAAVPPQQDLARCQRFYQTGVAWAYYSNAAAGTIVGNTYPLPVRMRAAPAGASILTPSNVNIGALSFNALGPGAMGVFGTATAAGTVSISNEFSASAEL